MSLKMKEEDLNYEFSFFESEMENSIIYAGKKKNKKVRPEKIIAITFFISIIIILEYFFGKKTKYISLLIFGNNNYKRCILLNKLDLYKYDIRYIFIFIMFTYINMYAVFCYMIIDIVLLILNDIIRLLFFESRPFWDQNSDAFPCVCDYTPSNPSPTAASSFLFFSLYIFVQYELKLKNKKNSKNNCVETKTYAELNDSTLSADYTQQRENYSNLILFFLAFLLISLILFIDTIPLLQNIEYLHQTIFGISLSYTFFYLIFYIFHVNHLSRKQFMKVIKQPWIILTFSIILIFLIFFILNNIANTITASQIDEIEKFCDIPDDINLSTEILKNCSLLFEVLGVYCGILLEFKITFKSKEQKFLFYNVNSKENQRYNEECNQFNKLIIFLLLFFIEFLVFKTLIEFWIKNHLDGIYQFSALSIELFLKGIFFFYIMKRLMSKIGLLNNIIFEKRSK